MPWLNREFGICQSGHATVTASKSAGRYSHLQPLGKFPGKAQRSYELEPGELPNRQSPLDLRATGTGILQGQRTMPMKWVWVRVVSRPNAAKAKPPFRSMRKGGFLWLDCRKRIFPVTLLMYSMICISK